MYEWLKVLEVMNDENKDDYLSKYEELTRDALELLNAGAITRTDIQKNIKEHSRSLEWDVVMIDESQDWPENERDILYSLYGANKFILADGVDQLVRGTKLIDWRERLPAGCGSQVVPLRKSLRLKSDLCKVVTKFAEEIDYPNWDLQPIPESHGGRFCIYTGNPFNRKVFESVLHASREDGNENIDNLVCVPPSLAMSNTENGESLAARNLKAWGYSVWDGVSSDTRSSFSVNVEDIRIVQYDSCRGLEGWAVLNLCFDEFFEFKRDSADIADKAKEDLFFNENEAAIDYAKRWLMIPMTRAIDTLVIHISDIDSVIGQAFYAISQRYPDEVEWIEGE